MSAGPVTPKAGGSENLRLRIISALVLIAVSLAATWAGGMFFRLFCAVISAAIFFEWSAMTRSAAATTHHMVLAALLGVILIALVLGLEPRLLVAALVVSIVAGCVLAFAGGHGFWPVGGLAYAGSAGLALSLLRGAEQAGLAAIVFLFAVVWATDILAYFTGRSFGGPKLAPAISPGKTWSGAIGGTAGGIIAGSAAGLAYGFGYGVILLVLLSLALSVVSQVGDLFESFLKRRFHVKDSGNLIPGHGGVMDRVDGLVAAAFVLAVVAAAVGGLEGTARALFPA